MRPETKMAIIKSIHTAIWVAYNIIIFYMLYAAVANRLDKYFWTGCILVALEGIVLLLFRFVCPLTILARRYSNSGKDNFDIYLPVFLAKYTKVIYTSLSLVIMLITIYQLLK